MSLGHNGDGGAVEVWENIDGHFGNDNRSVNSYKSGQGGDEQTMDQGKTDKVVEHF